MKKTNNQYRNKRGRLNAIFFSPVKCGTENSNFLKYRGIKDNYQELEKFEANIRRLHPTVIHVNYYCMATRTYLRQKKFT
jgi:hypothetical protein